MLMRFFVPAIALTLSAIAVGQVPAPQAAADSKADHSTVSLAVEPKLDDGRVVIKLAAQNRTADPVPFGPENVTIAELNGKPVAFMSLQQLTNDVRLAAGIKPDITAPSSNTYATQGMTTDSTGHLDVSNFHGSMGISGDQVLRDTRKTAPSKPTITKTQAGQQIAVLKQAILQDSNIAPGQIAVGELVSSPLTFSKSEERTLHIWVKIAGDEHTFTIAAPNQ